MDVVVLMRWLGVNAAWDSSAARIEERSAKQAYPYNPSRKMTQSASFAFDTPEA